MNLFGGDQAYLAIQAAKEGEVCRQGGNMVLRCVANVNFQFVIARYCQIGLASNSVLAGSFRSLPVVGKEGAVTTSPVEGSTV